MQNSIPSQVIVALGGNLSLRGRKPVEILELALQKLPEFGFRLVRRSSWWVSSAWPNPMDPPYINGIALVETGYTPSQALAQLHSLETAFGRVRSDPNAPRTLDLDMIDFAGLVCDPTDGEALELPHPRAADRAFVMRPLAEIAPNWRHPRLGLTAEALAKSARIGVDAQRLAPPD